MLRTDPECPVCRGIIECKGGGNIRCRQRNPHAAHIALILDTYGGARTIVADKQSLKANVRPDEFVHVVPRLLVHEPIAWGDIPLVIERARLEFEKWLDSRPNLTEEMQQAVTLYRLHGLREQRSKGSIDLYSIVET